MQKTELEIKSGCCICLIGPGFSVSQQGESHQWGRSESGAVVRHESSQTLREDTQASHTCRRKIVQDSSREKSGQQPSEIGWPLPRWVAQNRSNSDDLCPSSYLAFLDGMKLDRYDS